MLIFNFYLKRKTQQYITIHCFVGDEPKRLDIYNVNSFILLFMISTTPNMDRSEERKKSKENEQKGERVREKSR